MTFTGQLGTPLSMPGNIALGGIFPAAGGHPGFGSDTGSTATATDRKSRRNRAWQQQMQRLMPNDDDTALQMLLDAEDADVYDALLAYETALRRLM